MTSETPHTILVVEDNAFVRMQIVTFLKGESYDVVECADGLTAVEALTPQIKVIVADVRMEPMDGLEFIRNVRSRNYETPVILATGDDNPDLLNEARKCGVFAVLMKPVERDRLIKTVERAVNLAQRQG